MARRLGDDAALIELLSAAAMVNWPPERVAARAAATDEVLALTARRGDLAAVFWARTMRLRDALEAGDLATVDAELDRLARLAADEPPHLLPLVPARAAGGARAVRRPACRG